MDSFSVKMNILANMLAKKKEILLQILGITENQEYVLLSDQDSAEVNTFFNEMIHAKQTLIEKIIECDNKFQSFFDSFRNEFEINAESHKPMVKEMQNMIKEVMDIDVKIRVLEEKNKMLTEKRKAPVKNKTLMHSREYVTKKYEKNKNPDFFDI